MDEGVFSVCVTHHNVDLKQTVKYTRRNRVRISQMLTALLNMFQSIKSNQCKYMVTVQVSLSNKATNTCK